CAALQYDVYCDGEWCDEWFGSVDGCALFVDVHNDCTAACCRPMSMQCIHCYFHSGNGEH
ncbi:hypothetical protein J2X42_003080, partial [Arthrobacter sp. BE255]|nr:hypothetical protein [Arthrobacter sp. BE255]